MSAPVYVGKHETGVPLNEVIDALGWLVCICTDCRKFRRQPRPEPRHYKPCPDCRDTGQRVRSWNGPVQRVAGVKPFSCGGTFTEPCPCGASPYTWNASNLPLADLAVVQRDGVVGGLLADRPGGVPQPPLGVHHHTPKAQQ